MAVVFSKQLLARKLGSAVSIYRVRNIFLGIGLVGGAVENEVGAYMQDPGADFFADMASISTASALTRNASSVSVSAFSTLV